MALSSKEYWDARYTQDPQPFDWYQRYKSSETFKAMLAKYLIEKARTDRLRFVATLYSMAPVRVGRGWGCGSGTRVLFVRRAHRNVLPYTEPGGGAVRVRFRLGLRF